MLVATNETCRKLEQLYNTFLKIIKQCITFGNFLENNSIIKTHGMNSNVKVRFILLTAVRNILFLDNSAERSNCCVSVAILKTFIVLTATCRPTTIKRESIVAFSWQQWLRELTLMSLYSYIAYFVNIFIHSYEVCQFLCYRCRASCYSHYINQHVHWIKYIRKLLWNSYVFRHRGAIIRGTFNIK